MAPRFRARPSVASRTTGIAEVDAKLAALSSKVARRVVRKASIAGQKVLKAAIVRNIDSTAGNVSPDLRRLIRATVGSRFRKKRGRDEMDAKVGVNVGKRAKPRARSGANSGGVGIAAANIHWAILGTVARYVRKRNNRFAGRMKQFPVIRRAAAAAMQQAQAVVRKLALEEIEGEIAKLR